MLSWGLYKRDGACWSYTGIIGVPLDTGSGSGTLAESAAVPTLASALRELIVMMDGQHRDIRFGIEDCWT